MEWLNTDNIAIIVLVAGNCAQWVQWTRERKESREREIAAIQDANDRDRGYMARMEEQAMLTRQLTRGQIALGSRMKAVEKLLRAIQAGGS